MNQRIKELDGIRGIAILMIVVWHYGTCQVNYPASEGLLSILYLSTTVFWSGVDLFFVLSGFLIGGIILDNYKKENFLKVFWIRRACRIFPVLIVLLVACGAGQAILNTDQFSWLFNNLMPWWSYATFTQNILMGVKNTFGGNFLGITWSLAIEEQFYIIAPLLIVIFGRKTWIRTLLPLVLLAIVLRLVFPGFHGYVNTLFRMDALLIGVLIAVIRRNHPVWNMLYKNRAVIFMIMCGFLAASGALINVQGLGYFKFTWFAVLYGSLILIVLLYEGTNATRPLRSPLLCFWGSIAYGLYMYHQAVSGLLHGWLRTGATPSLNEPSGVMVTGVSFFVSTFIAWFSYRIFESFFLKLGKRQKYESINVLQAKQVSCAQD